MPKALNTQSSDFKPSHQLSVRNIKQRTITYHGLVHYQFVGRRLVGCRHGGRSVHAVVYLVECVETRAGVRVCDGLAQQLADLDGVCC